MLNFKIRAGMFSIMDDETKNLAKKEQLAIFLCYYLKGKVYEIAIVMMVLR